MKRETVADEIYTYYQERIKSQELSLEEEKEILEKEFRTEFSHQKMGRYTSFFAWATQKNGIAYAAPTETPEEICERCSNKDSSFGENMFKQKEIILLPYIAGKTNHMVFHAKNDEEIYRILSTQYTPAYFVTKLLYNYPRIEEFQEYLSLIQEAIENYLENHVASAIHIVLACLEGISRKYCDKRRLNYNPKNTVSAFQVCLADSKKIWRDGVTFFDWEQKKAYTLPLAFQKNRFLRKIDISYDILDTYCDYGNKILYESNSDKLPNRHSIDHGVNTIYNTPLNFLKLFVCLEVLQFAITQDMWVYGSLDSGLMATQSDSDRLLRRFYTFCLLRINKI